MDLETFMVTTFCLVDDGLAEFGRRHRIRARGPQPILADSEVITMELVGEYLGIDTDVGIVRYFRQHHAALFPRITQIHRTTFARQAANLWVVKQELWQWLRDQLGGDPALSLVDSMPVAICRFAHAPACQRFRGIATFGQDSSSRAVYYGLRLHLRVSAQGTIVALQVAPANVPDVDLVPELVEGAEGTVLGDRAYWHQPLAEALHPAGVALVAPFRKRSSDPTPQRSRRLNRVRRRIETTFSQLVQHFRLKTVWARDCWHLTARLTRKICSHTLGIVLMHRAGHTDTMFQLSHLMPA
jgi:hypothetical protein